MELLFLVTLIALAPSILIMMTSFTRIIIVLSFMRALGTSSHRPIRCWWAWLFLTLYIMQLVLTTVNEQAYQPYTRVLSLSRVFRHSRGAL